MESFEARLPATRSRGHAVHFNGGERGPCDRAGELVTLAVRDDALLCAYDLRDFQQRTERGGLPDLCARIPAESYAEGCAAIDRHAQVRSEPVDSLLHPHRALAAAER